VPLSPFQSQVLQLLSGNRSEDSYLAGASALHLEPNSIRMSEDLDFFHDIERAVSDAFERDAQLLTSSGYRVEVDLKLTAYIRATIHQKQESVKIEWARDSAWRFLPLERSDIAGFTLSRIDLVINKLLALVGRDEPRDYIDVVHLIESDLPLGAQIWAACGKDPGFTPEGILDLCRRKGRYRPEDFDRLKFNDRIDLTIASGSASVVGSETAIRSKTSKGSNGALSSEAARSKKSAIDLVALKARWLKAIESAETFIEFAPAETLGALFFDQNAKRFIQPVFPQMAERLGRDLQVHSGRPGGVLPVVLD